MVKPRPIGGSPNPSRRFRDRAAFCRDKRTRFVPSQKKQHLCGDDVRRHHIRPLEVGFATQRGSPDSSPRCVPCYGEADLGTANSTIAAAPDWGSPDSSHRMGTSAIRSHHIRPLGRKKFRKCAAPDKSYQATTSVPRTSPHPSHRVTKGVPAGGSKLLWERRKAPPNLNLRLETESLPRFAWAIFRPLSKRGSNWHA